MGIDLFVRPKRFARLNVGAQILFRRVIGGLIP